MAQVARGNARLIVTVALVVLVAAAAVVVFLTRPGTAPTASTAASQPATTESATQPATTRVAKAARQQPPPTHYLEVLRTHHPRMPQTQPLPVPLDLSQAARLRFAEPVYLSPRGDLWIARPDAPPTPEVLARAAKEQGDQLTLTTREQVLFAHWTPQEKGPWTFTLVVRGEGGRDEVVTQSRRTPITSGRTYHWDRAMDWGERVVVATDTGVSVFSFQPELRELHVDLIDPKSEPGGAFAEPQFLLDWEGLLAWVPWEGRKHGSAGAARFLNDKWLPIGPEQGWPAKLLHLIPLYDGGVLQLVPDDEFVRLAFTSLEQVAIDEALVAQHVEKLSSPDEAERDNAFKELNRYGTSAWPILAKMIGDQGPEAQARLKLLLKNRDEPTLGGFSVLGDKLKVVARLADGGAVFYAEVGVATAGEGEEPVIRSPAWVSVRPGQAVSLLNEPFTVDFNPDRTQVWAFGDEWIVTNNALGPQRFVGNGYVPLLKKSELAFGEPVGIDRRGRWIFRKRLEGEARATTGPSTTPVIAPTTTTAPATSPATTTTADDAQFLILDPTIPDPTPRLPVWAYSTAETVGWDKDNWPAVKRGGAWALRGDDWGPMKRTDTQFTDRKDLPPPPPPPPPPATSTAPTQPATTTTSTTSTAPAEDLGPVLLVDRDGNYYYDGKSRLVVITKSSERIEWPLPPAATGSLAMVHLARTDDGLLFLYNQPGRLLRIRPTPDEPEPFVLEATFTRNIPNADNVTRLWVDPGGRLIMAYGTKLAIMFPQGFIPPAIAAKMPPGQTDADE